MGEDIDVEALQAQIDLSNSIAYDLVSSWTKSSSNKDTESVSKSIAKDLEEHAKRPPRLGLGASVSKSSIATSREAARLKGKLIGAKRARQDGGDSTLSTGGVQDDENEDESRSAAISTKKFRMNGTGGLAFGKNKGKGKAVLDEPGDEVVTEEDEGGMEMKRKKKKHHNEDPSEQDKSTSNVNSTPSKRNPFVVPDTPFPNTSIIDLTSPSPAGLPAGIPTRDSASPKKKKKHKNKNKDTGEDEEWHGFSNESLELMVDPGEEQPGLAHQAPSPIAASPPLNPNLSSPSSVIDLTSPIRPTPSPSRVLPPNSPTRGESIPLLNLQGPPLSGSEEYHNEGSTGSGSPKRKRPKRRRGRGRKSQGGDPGE